MNGKYESGDSLNSSYSGKGFLQKAFTSFSQSKIKTISVATGCSDKIFTLAHSTAELINTSYGFSSELKDDAWRKRDTTQYGTARTLNNDGSGGYYWSRTPSGTSTNNVDIVYGDGSIRAWTNVTQGDFGIVPALCVSEL